MRQIVGICMFLFLLSVGANAQTAMLNGKVTDSQKEPIAYASVALMEEDGNTLAAGTISNSEGQFSFNEQPTGRYVLSVSFVGYKTLKLPVDLQKDMTLDCVLADDAIQIGEVTVEANRSNTVKRTAQGQTFMLSAASMKKKDIIQALQEIPALTIDPDTRKIFMSNGSQPLVLINGVRREGGLSAISPEDIISVDVVQTASAEFMREGYTSVVNIKVKKSDRKYMLVNAGINTHPAIRFGIADASLETGNSRSSFYLSAQSFAFLNNKSDMTENTTTAGSLRELTYKRNSHYDDTYVALGGDRLWNDRQYSSFSMTFDYIPQWSEAEGKDRITDRTTGEVTDYRHWRELNDKSYTGSLNLYHKYRFENASAIDFLLQLSLSKNTNRADQWEENEYSSYGLFYDFHNSRTGISFTPSYQFALAGFQFKMGLNTYFLSNRIKQRGESPSAFSHREWDEYLYLNVNREWGRFSLAASLGIDAVYRKVEEHKDNYYNLRPVIGVGYHFNTRHSLAFQFNMQSVSPGIVQLNPYNTSSDTLTVSSGNPYLKPYHISKYRLSYTMTEGAFYIEPSLEYRRIDDAIVSAGEDKGGYYEKSLANQGKSTLFSGGVNVRYTIKRTGYVGIRFMYHHLEYPDIRQKNDYFSGYAYGGLDYGKAGLTFSYGLPDYSYDMYMRTYSSPESNLTLTYNVSDNWNIMAGMRFIGWKKHIERYTEMPGYSYYYDNRFTNRGNIFMIGARYKLRKHSKADREQKKLQNTEKGFRLISE